MITINYRQSLAISRQSMGIGSLARF